MSDITSSSIGSLYLNNTYDTSSSTSKLESSLKSSDLSNASDEELMSACKQFESYFVEQVFKAMEKMVPEDETSSSTSSLKDYYKDQLLSQYASDASESNGGEGLGIAKTLYEQMKRNYGITE